MTHTHLFIYTEYEIEEWTMAKTRLKFINHCLNKC